MHSRQERVVRDEAPLQLCEHVARYRLASQVIDSADVWIDLGCGSGLAASAALEKPFDGELLLVDSDSDALQTASETVTADPQATQLCLDLSQPGDVEALRKRIEKIGSKKQVLITCFDLLPHLENFEPLLAVLVDVATERGANLLISLPNDDYIPRPDEKSKTIWGKASLTELEIVLPAEHRVFKQHPLAGSRITTEKVTKENKVTVSSLIEEVEPSGYIVAIGPAMNEFSGGSEVASVDLAASRLWENTREADLAWLNRRVIELEAELALHRTSGSIAKIAEQLPELPTNNGN